MTLRGDDVACCDGAFTIGDDIASCDELASAEQGESLNEVKDCTGPPMWVGFTDV